MTAIFTKDELKMLAKRHAREEIGDGRHEVFVFDTFGLAEIAQYFIDKEREECAKVCDSRNAAYCAFSIRERGAP
jgi:hypothetical protein